MAKKKRKNTGSYIEKKEMPDSGSPRLGEIGSPWLRTSGAVIREISKRELQFPRSLCTYDDMSLDDAVGAVLALNSVFISNSLINAYCEGNPDNPESVRFANYLNWNLQNLEYQTWWDVIQNITLYSKYGFSVLQKVFGVNSSTTFDYPYKIRKLQGVNPYSIQRWVWSEDYRELRGFYQWPITSPVQSFGLVNPIYSTTLDGELFRRNKFMLFSWDSTNNNPEGRSPLSHIYKIVKEKQWLSDFEVIGVSREHGGTPVLRIPTEILNKASVDPESQAADTVKDLQMQAANIRKGDQAYVIISSDTLNENGTGAYEYDIKLLENSGTKIDTSKLIDQRNKAIFNSQGASHLYLGQDGGGSYALAETNNALHAHYMRKHINFIISVVNNDLIPQFAALNGVVLSEDDMPKLKPSAVEEISLDEVSKMVSRVKSVDGLVLSKENIISYHSKLGFDTTHMEGLSQEELIELMVPADGGTSRAGESIGSSGTGVTQIGGLGSDSNNENAS